MGTVFYLSHWPSHAMGKWESVRDSGKWVELRSDHTFTSHYHDTQEENGNWDLFCGTMRLQNVKYYCNIYGKHMQLLYTKDSGNPEELEDYQRVANQ